jgi:hypothetical protein
MHTYVCMYTYVHTRARAHTHTRVCMYVCIMYVCMYPRKPRSLLSPYSLASLSLPGTYFCARANLVHAGVPLKALVPLRLSRHPAYIVQAYACLPYLAILPTLCKHTPVCPISPSCLHCASMRLSALQDGPILNLSATYNLFFSLSNLFFSLSLTHSLLSSLTLLAVSLPPSLLPSRSLYSLLPLPLPLSLPRAPPPPPPPHTHPPIHPGRDTSRPTCSHSWCKRWQRWRAASPKSPSSSSPIISLKITPTNPITRRRRPGEWVEWLEWLLVWRLWGIPRVKSSPRTRSRWRGAPDGKRLVGRVNKIHVSMSDRSGGGPW